MTLSLRQAHDAPNGHGGEFDLWTVRRLLAGMHPKVIVVATDGRISIRTAYRWRQEFTGTTRTIVGEHVAWFGLRNGRPPVRLTDWAAL